MVQWYLPPLVFPGQTLSFRQILLVPSVNDEEQKFYMIKLTPRLSRLGLPQRYEVRGDREVLKLLEL